VPHAIFDSDVTIHGTNDISPLVGRASHGCVRLHPSNAGTLFSLVQHNGRNTTIEISNQAIRICDFAPCICADVNCAITVLNGGRNNFRAARRAHLLGNCAGRYTTLAAPPRIQPAVREVYAI